MLASLRPLSSALLAVLDLVYPPQCAACNRPLGSSSELLCPACRAEFSEPRGPRCPLCSCPLSDARDTADPDPSIDVECPNCSEWSAAFDGLLVLAPFEGPAQQAVHALKFKQNRRLGTELGRIVGSCSDLSGELAALQALIPVPLHPARQRERGYNQSLLLAEGIASVLGIPIKNKILRRTRATRQQAVLTAGDRQDNLLGAFEVTGALDPELLVGVVDDVVTTGSTLSACAHALKQAGVRSVWGVAVASPFRQAG